MMKKKNRSPKRTEWDTKKKNLTNLMRINNLGEGEGRGGEGRKRREEEKLGTNRKERRKRTEKE